MLRLINVCKSYKCGKNREVILDNINLDFKKHELVFILGKSGSGKSTLLNIIGGILDVDSGKVMLDDRDITKFNNNMLCSYRNNMIGYIFQNYHLVEYMSVIDNIKLGQTIYDTDNQLEDVLRKLGIYSKRRMIVNKLSGGEKQRVAIARAIINNPDIILCDEPTGALDNTNSIKIMNILKKISKDKLVIVVSHDNILASEYADRIVNIDDGKMDYIPCEDDEIKFREIKKKKISLLSIMKLARKNLTLKWGRTLFTSLAISLGFVCMLLVLCLSKSFNEDIDKLEEEVVSAFPISIYNGEFEILDNIDNNVSSDNEIIIKKKDDYIHENKINQNFLNYIDKIDEISYVSYNYDISMPVVSDRYKKISNNYMKMLPSSSFIDDNYDILYGENINSMYEILLKIDSNNNVDEELLNVFNIDEKVLYEDLVGRKLRVILNDIYYIKNGDYYLINNNDEENYCNSDIELEIVGIVREKEVVDDKNYFYFDSGLVNYILNKNSDSEIVLDQLDKDYNVLGIEMDRYKMLSYLGYESLPSGIDIYISNVIDKEIVVSKLDKYNNENDKLVYIDTMREAIDILKNIINIITIILVLFSMISILVSSLMVFILTNNRVMERVKEIGILRSLGARNRDISRLFNMENLFIGIISSIIGMLFVLWLRTPINSLMGILLDSEGMFIVYKDLAIISIIFNIFMVVLSGLIPTKIAGKKSIMDCIS